MDVTLLGLIVAHERQDAVFSLRKGGNGYVQDY
jgi:hypothetical protein